jgi:hypothetical protein
MLLELADFSIISLQPKQAKQHVLQLPIKSRTHANFCINNILSLG